jgi:multidrug efflux pump subunit AcrA (membrane-fusion protein)
MSRFRVGMVFAPGRHVDIVRAPVRRTRRTVAAAFAGALLVAGVSVGLREVRPAAPAVERTTVWMDTVRRGPMVREVFGQGRLVPVDVRWITARNAAQVERVLVMPGSAVQADTVLLELSNSELELAALEAEREFSQAEAELVNLDATLRAQELAQAAFGRRELFPPGDAWPSSTVGTAPGGAGSNMLESDWYACLRRCLGGVVIALCGLALASGAAAEDVALPVPLQIALLLKVASYDKNLAERAGERVIVAVLIKTDDTDSARAGAQALSALSGADEIGGLPVETRSVAFSSAAALAHATNAERFAVLYVTPGFHEAEMGPWRRLSTASACSASARSPGELRIFKRMRDG